MTIYKPNGVPKKESGVPPPEVVVQSQTLLKKEPAIVGRGNPSQTVSPLATSLAVYQARKRRNKMIMICNILIAIAVIAIGVVGGIALYRHLAKKSLRSVCGVKYFEYEEESKPFHSRRQKIHRGEFEETIEVDSHTWAYERIDVPQIEECQRATIIHDFDKNMTAVVDRDHHHCFVMPLNRTIVKPPHDLIDLVFKLQSRYYLPDMEIVREKFKVVTPPLDNLGSLGYYIWRECRMYNTYKLSKAGEPLAMSKRSAGESFCHASYSLGAASTKYLEFVELAGCV